jgi:hypothetical protein
MAFQRLREENIVAFSSSPEMAMGVQLALIPGSDSVVFVIEGQVAVFGDDALFEQLETFLSQPWMTTRATDFISAKAN